MHHFMIKMFCAIFCKKLYRDGHHHNCNNSNDPVFFLQPPTPETPDTWRSSSVSLNRMSAMSGHQPLMTPGDPIPGAWHPSCRSVAQGCPLKTNSSTWSSATPAFAKPSSAKSSSACPPSSADPLPQTPRHDRNTSPSGERQYGGGLGGGEAEVGSQKSL